MKTAALLIFFVVAIGGAIVLVARSGVMSGFGGGLHMWIAMILGVGATVGLGVGLMALSFHSNTHGYDDAASSDD